MKKVYLLSIFILTLFVIVGCSSGQFETTETGSDSTNEEPVIEYEYFKENEVKLHNLKIKITDTKVIQPGDTGNEYGEEPVFAIWYEVTNLSGEDINPMMAWLLTFKAIQDNNPNAINELNVSSLPDDQFLYSQSETIKKGGTVKDAVAYKLDDLETPVTLIVEKGGDKLGEQTFNLK